MNDGGWQRRASVWLALGGVIVLGFALRLFLSIMAFSTTFDTATVGLMGVNILQGEFPLFYYGQTYMGALEAYVAAVMFAIFGISTTALSLSPILFALGWIGGTYVLFRDLMNARAGYVAALCVAACGWYPMWFSLGSYGGYSIVFCIGTWWMVLALRLAAGHVSARREWACALALGVLAGLGLWVNFQVLAYLVTGSVFLLIRLVRARSPWRLLLKLAAGGVVALGGLIPFGIAGGDNSASSLLLGRPSLALIKNNIHVFLDRCLYKLIFWPVWSKDDMPRWIFFGVILVLVLAFVLAACVLWQEVVRRRRWATLAPVVFVIIFLALYLPHPMASLGAVRYLIPFQLMTICAVFAYPVAVGRRSLRWAGLVLFLLWMLYNIPSTVATGLERRERNAQRRADRTSIVDQARAADLKHVMLIGSGNDGHLGQIYSFYAKSAVRFVSPFDERHAPSARAAELDPRAGLMCKSGHLPRVTKGLAAAGVTGYIELPCPGWTILHRFDVPHSQRRSIVPAELRAAAQGVEAGTGADVLDRREETALRGDFRKPAELTIDLGRLAVVDGFWLTAPLSGRLPDSYRVSASTNGVDYAILQDVTGKVPNTYVCGNRVYVVGDFARRDARWPPLAVRFLRITFVPVDRRREWSINEIHVFEHVAGAEAVTEAEVDDLAQAVRRHDVVFTVCDRWLSAQLALRLEPRGGQPPVFPRYNRKDRSSRLDRVLTVRPSWAVVVDLALRAETAALLARVLADSGVRVEAEPFAHYVLFTFAGEASAFKAAGSTLTWNGHTLVAGGVVE